MKESYGKGEGTMLRKERKENWKEEKKEEKEKKKGEKKGMKKKMPMKTASVRMYSWKTMKKSPLIEIGVDGVALGATYFVRHLLEPAWVDLLLRIQN